MLIRGRVNLGFGFSSSACWSRIFSPAVTRSTIFIMSWPVEGPVTASKRVSLVSRS
mgnify:CR=1 FL=1